MLENEVLTLENHFNIKNSFLDIRKAFSNILILENNVIF